MQTVMELAVKEETMSVQKRGCSIPSNVFICVFI